MTEMDLLSRIKASYSKFTKLEAKVADYVLHNAPSLMFTSITDLAELCGVGDTTVFRFCKTLKLNGYQEFKMLLARSLSSVSNEDSFSSGLAVVENNKISPETLKKSVSALHDTYNSLDIDDLRKVTALIRKANRVAFFGMGSSSVVALMTQYKFLRIMPKVEYSMDCHMQYTKAALMSDKDLAIVFCYSGSTKDTIDITALLKQKKCPVVGVTRFLKSPFAHMCDIVLESRNDEGPYQGGSFETTISQLFVAEMLYNQYFIENYDECKKNKELTSQSVADKQL